MEQPRSALISGDRLMADRLLAAIEQLNESIVLTDAEDRFVLANRAFRELNRNIPHAILPGQKFDDYLRAGLAAGNYPDAVGREKEWLEARLAERRNPGNPVERQRSAGRWFLIDDRRLPDGGTIRFGTEITDRKRAQTESNERGRDLQLIVDSVPQMITRLGRDERFLFANRAYAELMERSVEDIVGRRIAEVVAPEIYAQIKPALDRALSGDPVSIERVQYRSNGEPVELEGRYIPDVDVAGRVIGLIAVHRDVTAERRAQRALAESEAHFRGAFQLGLIGMAITSPAKIFLDVNDALCRMLGYSREHLIGATWAQYTHADDLAANTALLEHALAGKTDSYSMRKRYLRADGSVMDAEVAVSCVREPDGPLRHFVLMIQDITERKRAEEALRVNAERLMIGQAAGKMIVLDWDIRHDQLDWSDSPEWLRGPLPPDGKYPLFKDQVHPDDRENFLATRAKAIRTLQGQTPEFRIVRTDGQVRWIQSRQKLFADESGKAVRMLVALHDVTERKQKEQALAASEARFRAIYERSSAGMAISDADGTYLSVNAAFARFFGYAADEIVGKLKVSDLRAADDAEGAALYRQLVLGEIAFFERERQYQRKDGVQIWGHATCSAVRDADGKVSYVVAVFSDITEKVLARARVERMNTELEERVEARTAELRAALKELDAFTYSVSHDLRAPVGAVSGFAHLLRTSEAARLSADGQHLLGVIEDNAARMTSLIEGLLRFSRLGRSDLRPVLVSMNDLVSESLLDFVDATARADIQVGALPHCEGDRSLLGQVWSNLIGNALKYSRTVPAPRINIGWNARRSANYIRDNGVGFDMAYVGKLFGVFERLHHESEFEGSGIGLAIAERIVKRHGGAIWAEAAPDHGATFWFTLTTAAGDAAHAFRSSPDTGR